MAYLGIDIGTFCTKVLAITTDGGILANDLQTYPCYAPKPIRSKLNPGDVKAIGLSGQMHGSVFLDKNDKVIRRAILGNDQWTAAECEEIGTAI